MNKYIPRGVKGVFLIRNVKHCPETYENFKFHASQVLLRRKNFSMPSQIRVLENIQPSQMGKPSQILLNRNTYSTPSQMEDTYPSLLYVDEF